MRQKELGFYFFDALPPPMTPPRSMLELKRNRVAIVKEERQRVRVAFVCSRPCTPANSLPALDPPDLVRCPLCEWLRPSLDPLSRLYLEAQNADCGSERYRDGGWVT